MIRDISKKSLALSLALLTSGTAGAYSLVWKMAGDESASDFLPLVAAAEAAIFLLQLAVYIYMGKRIIFQLVFLAVFGLSLAWFMFALFVPLLWINILPLEIKIFLAGTLVILSFSNVVESFRKFDKKWNGLEESVRLKRLNLRGDTINWDRLIYSMNLTSDFYIPGFSKRLSVVIGIGMVVFMIVGLNLRGLFPVFSAFAWGIPSALVVAFIFQLIGFNLAQARKVRMLEVKYKVLFRQIL